MQGAAIQILFEDAYLLAVNKPPGIVAESAQATHQTLQAQALSYIRSKEKYPDKCFMGLPHRLDRPVSGVVLLAKKKSVLKMLAETFAGRQVGKTYLAITKHCPEKKEGVLINWLVKDMALRKAIIYNQEIKGASRVELRYQVIAQQNHKTLLQIELITGKYHQIRAQLSHAGCPIIGDSHYGSSVLYRTNAIGLHAYRLQLIHPVTNEQLEITAPPPDEDLWNDFKKLY